MAVVTLIQAKAEIERIYKEKREKASVDLANSINVIIHNVLEGRLIYEFIQNADDATEVGRHSSISFTLQDSLLIISHNGRHFNAKDVEKICRVAQQEYLDKGENDEMIGQKGIGIKVAFSEAEEMIVYSAPYCFRFQERYEAWADATRSNPYPWQITPIWTDVNQLPPNLDTAKVHFILKLKNSQRVHGQLQEVLANPSILLFLNRIRRIFILGQEFLMEVNLNNGERSISCQGVLQSRWIYYRASFDIPTDVSKDLTHIDHYSCPDKYRKVGYKLRMAFAFPFNDQGLLAAVNTVISCYLPTTVHCDLPFLVNADFLLDASRKHLKLNNLWNRFIFEKLASYHFYCLEQMAKQPKLRKGILQVLAPPEVKGLDPVFAAAYATAYKTAAKVTPFIPSQIDPSQLRTLVNCNLDKTGFIREFRDRISDPLWPSYVDDQLDQITVLDTVHKVPMLLLTQLIQQCRQYLTAQPALLKPILEFFMNHWPAIRQLPIGQFKEQLHLPNGHGGMSPLSQFLLQVQIEISYPPCLKIPYFSQESLTQPLLMWLEQTVGLTYLSTKEIIRGPLATFVREGKTDTTVTVSIMRFLYSACHEGSITVYDLNLKIPLLTQSGKMVPANRCYLPNCYRPAFELEGVVNNPDLFVSNGYFQPGDDPDAWKSVFKILGAKDNISLRHVSSATIASLKAENVPYLKDYLEIIYKDKETSPLKARGNNDSHILLNFVFLPFMDLLHQRAYAGQFWGEVLRNWELIQKCCKNPLYKLSTDTRPLWISYLGFMVGKIPICTIQGVSDPSEKLYAPQLAPLVGEFYSTVYVPQGMTNEQAEFFGFRVTVHPLHCLDIFERWRREERKVDFNKYAELLKQIIDGYSLLDPNEQKEFKQKEKWVLAENGSWQRCTSQLLCSLISGAIERFDRSNRVKVVLPLDQMENCGKIMGFGILSSSSQINSPIGEEDEILTADLRSKLPLIALCEATVSGDKEALTVLKGLIPILRSLKIVQTDIIQLSEDTKDTTEILMLKGTLFYQKRCADKKGKIGRELCHLLHLSLPMLKLLPEIISLKDTTITGRSKGINTFLEERGLSSSSLHVLSQIYSAKECALIEEEPIEKKETTLPHLPAIEKKKESSPERLEKNQPLPPTQEPGPPLSQNPSEIKPSSTFQPQLEPAKFDFSKVQLRQVETFEKQETLEGPRHGQLHPSHPAPQIHKVPKSSQSDDEIKAIGRFGEDFVFNYFIHRYKNHETEKHKTKLQFVRSQDIDDGIKITCIDSEQKEVDIRIVWLNKKEGDDSGEQRDIDLAWIRGDQVVKQRWVEIKTSTANNVHFYLSTKEWAFMDSHFSQYRLYHVACAASSNPIITKFKTLIGRGLKALNKIEFVGTTKQ